MDAARREYLMTSFVAGTIAGDEAAELYRLISADKGARRDLLRQMQVAGVLATTQRQPAGAAAVDRVMEAVSGWEQHKELVVDNVMDRLASGEGEAPVRQVIQWSVLRWAALGAAASVMAMLALWLAVGNPPGPVPGGASPSVNASPVVAQVVDVNGSAVAVCDGVERAVTPGMQLSSGMQIITAPATGSVIRLPSASPPVLKLRYVSHKSELAIESGTFLRLDGDRVVALNRGMITAVVEKQAPGKQFEVHARYASMRAIGTVFSVSGDDRSSSLKVDEGLVRMSVAGVADIFEDIGSGQVGVVQKDAGKIVRPGAVLKDFTLQDMTAAYGVASDGTNLWVLAGAGSGKPSTLLKMDPGDGRVISRTRLQPERNLHSALAWYDGSIWAIEGGQLIAIEPEGGTTVRSRKLPAGVGLIPRPFDIADDRVWIMDGYPRGDLAGRDLVCVDFKSMQVVSRTFIADSDARFLGVRGNNMFLAEPHSTFVSVLELGSSSFSSAIPVKSMIHNGDFALGPSGTMWVVDYTRAQALLIRTY